MSMKANPEKPPLRPSLVASWSRRAAANRDGGTAIEYALIAAGIGAAVAATVYTLGTTTTGLYQSIANML